MLVYLGDNDSAQPTAQPWSVARCSTLFMKGLLAKPQAVHRCSHVATCKGPQRLLLQKASAIACACMQRDTSTVQHVPAAGPWMVR